MFLSFLFNFFPYSFDTSTILRGGIQQRLSCYSLIYINYIIIYINLWLWELRYTTAREVLI
jgi:hypothetical protein